jgi:hypothetical protein
MSLKKIKKIPYLSISFEILYEISNYYYFYLQKNKIRFKLNHLIHQRIFLKDQLNF